MATSLSSSPEYATMRECTPLLVESIQREVERIGTKLFGDGFLSETERQTLQLPFLQPSTKANVIIDAVRNKIKFKPEDFQSFVDILKEQGPWMNDYVKELTTCYEQNKLELTSGSDQAVKRPKRDGPGFICPYCQKCTFQEYFKNGYRCLSAKDTEVSRSLSAPVLDTSNLSKNERCALKGQLRSELNKTETSFCRFCSSLVSSATNFPIAKITAFLLGKQIFTAEEVAKLEKANSMKDILAALYNHTSFFHYKVIAQIVNEFGSLTDKQNLQDYLGEFRAYCKHNVFEVPPSVFNSKVDQEQAEFALKYSPEHKLAVTLKEVDSLCDDIAAILEIDPWALRLVSIEEGCVLLTFAIPKAIAANVLPISPLQQKALSEIGLTVGKEDKSSQIGEDSLNVDWYSLQEPLTTDSSLERHSTVGPICLSPQLQPGKAEELGDTGGYSEHSEDRQIVASSELIQKERELGQLRKAYDLLLQESLAKDDEIQHLQEHLKRITAENTALKELASRFTVLTL